MASSNRLLDLSGSFCFAFALFQAAIGFSPGLSLYFGAPESLTQHPATLIGTSLAVAAAMAIFGSYLWSGAGKIRRLPALKWGLAGICIIFILRGLMVIPEFLAVAGMIDSPIPIAPRFVAFSLVALVFAVVMTLGTVRAWKSLNQ